MKLYDYSFDYECKVFYEYRLDLSALVQHLSSIFHLMEPDQFHYYAIGYINACSYDGVVHDTLLDLIEHNFNDFLNFRNEIFLRINIVSDSKVPKVPFSDDEDEDDEDDPLECVPDEDYEDASFDEDDGSDYADYAALLFL